MMYRPNAVFYRAVAGETPILATEAGNVASLVYQARASEELWETIEAALAFCTRRGFPVVVYDRNESFVGTAYP